MARDFIYEIDLAFFVVNFGFSKREFDELTNREIAFIKKAYENKMISDGYNMYNACFTAFYNANRPKRKKALKLFRKPKVQEADMAVIKNNLEIVKEIDQREGKTWVDKIYKANGLKRKR